MNYYGTQVNNLIEELRRLPGIGGKSAQRLAFHIINMPQEHVEHLAEVLVSARKNIRYCKCCCTLTDGELCPICASDKRDHSTIMVVEHTKDLAAYEKTGQYNGVYHVLQGTLVPSLGKGPDDIRFKELMERLDTTPVKELILATNSVWTAKPLPCISPRRSSPEVSGSRGSPAASQSAASWNTSTK